MPKRRRKVGGKKKHSASRAPRRLGARGVRTYSKRKRHHFKTCSNRNIRHAINSTWHRNPALKREAVSFLRKCYRKIKPRMVGKRGGITRSNYNTMAEKLGRPRLLKYNSDGSRRRY